MDKLSTFPSVGPLLNDCQIATHTSIIEGFKKSGPRCTKTIVLDYIRPVEFNGDTFEILGWGCTILILASFEGV